MSYPRPPIVSQNGGGILNGSGTEEGAAYLAEEITCTRSASFKEWVLVCDLHARLPTATGPAHDFPSNSSSFSLSRLLKLMLRCR